MIPYIIKTFRGGVSDENDKGIAGSFKHGYGLDIHKRNDSLSCGSTMATVLGESVGVLGSGVGTTMTGIFNVFLPISDGSLLAFSDRGSIWCMSGDGQWQFVYNDENGRISGAEEFKDINGDNYIFWATASAIARKPYPGAFSTAPDSGINLWTDATAEYKVEFVSSSAAWHTMKMIAGDLLIANSDSLSQYGYDATWDPLVLQLTPGSNITTLEERNDYVILGSKLMSQLEEGHIWSWVSTAINYVQKKKIPAKGVNALIYTEVPLVQAGPYGEIFMSDFSNAIPLHAIPGNGQCTPQGTTIEEQLGLFGIYGGSTVSYPGIWSYGRKAKNRNHALNYNYRLSPAINGSTISTIGAIVNFNGLVMAAWGTEDSHLSAIDSEYGIDMVTSTTSASAIYEGLEFDAGRPFQKKMFRSAIVTMVALPTNTSISLKYKFDKETDWRYGITGGNSTTFSNSGATEAEFIIGGMGFIFEVGMELNPYQGTSPEVLAITTYLDGESQEHK